MGDINKSYASRSTHVHYYYVSVCAGLAMSRLLARRLFPAIDCFKGFSCLGHDTTGLRNTHVGQMGHGRVPPPDSWRMLTSTTRPVGKQHALSLDGGSNHDGCCILITSRPCIRALHFTNVERAFSVECTAAPCPLSHLCCQDSLNGAWFSMTGLCCRNYSTSRLRSD